MLQIGNFICIDMCSRGLICGIHKNLKFEILCVRILAVFFSTYSVTVCKSFQPTCTVVDILRHARSIWMCCIFGQITHVTIFHQTIIQLYNVSPTWASSGTHNQTRLTCTVFTHVCRCQLAANPPCRYPAPTMATTSL